MPKISKVKKKSSSSKKKSTPTRRNILKNFKDPVIPEVEPDIFDFYNLDDVDRILIQNYIVNPGITLKTQAEAVGLTLQMVHKRAIRPEFQKVLHTCRGTTEEQLTWIKSDAMHRLRELIHSSSQEIALNAVKFILKPLFDDTSQLNRAAEIVWTTVINEDGSMTQRMEQKLAEQRLLKPKDETDG